MNNKALNFKNVFGFIMIVILCVLCSSVMYSICAFIEWDFDISNWHPLVRAVMLLGTISIFVGITEFFRIS